MADSNTMALRYVPEATWGVTPSAPLKTLRITSANLNNVNETSESQEILADAQLRDLLLNGQSAAGEFGFELSYGTYDELFEGLLRSSWATNVLSNGTTKRSYTFEKHFTDIGEFFAFRGCRIGGASLSLALGQPVTGTMSLIGKEAVPAGATAGTGAPTAATSTLPFKMTDITAISEGGSALAGATALSLQIDNGLRAQGQLGSAVLYGVGYGGFRVNGNLEVYFASRALLEKATNFTASALSFTLEDDAGNELLFQIPRIRYGNATVGNEGPNGDVLLRMPWTATLDPVTGRMLRITRTPAA